MLQQADHLARGLLGKGTFPTETTVTQAFERAFQRQPNQEELHAATALVKAQGLMPLCRMLINANEFVYID